MCRKAVLSVSLVMLLVVCAPLVSVRAHHAVLRFNLEEMVATADRIFVGKCIDVKETKEMVAKGIMPVTYYTFTVSQVIKGKVPQTITFKQLGHRPRKPAAKNSGPLVGPYLADPKTYIHGMSGYVIGDELLLMLIPKYSAGELTYPVGLYQGAFFITRSSSGKALVKNSINNRGLFTNPYTNFSKSESAARVIFPNRDRAIIDSKLQPQSVETLVSKPGALPLDDLVALLREIVVAEGRK